MLFKINFIDNEYWYCGIVNDGYLFPLSKDDDYSFNITFNDSYNQINPIFISSKGRFIWAENAKIKFNCGEIIIDGEKVEINEDSKNLKEAALNASKKYYAPDGLIPDKKLFLNPQYCTWVYLKYNSSQDGVIEYAESIINFGFKPGILIVDMGWSKAIGCWEFNGNFPNPKDMVEKLHKMGFSVVLWIVPYIDRTIKEVEELIKIDALMKKTNGEFVIAKWWEDESYNLDFTKNSAINWLTCKLNYLQKNYGIDGFKLDGGDSQFLPKDYLLGNLSNEIYGSFYKCNIIELRSAYKLGGKQIVQRLADKAHIWGIEKILNLSICPNEFIRYGLKSILPNGLIQNLVGYYYCCPDMIGGGLVYDYENDADFDYELVIRFLQVAALMPMIQFSYPFWKNEKIRQIFLNILQIREKFVDYIVELADIASRTGEPIIRFLEYEFSNQQLENVTDEFMLGDKYLVAPVLEKNAEKRNVRLPKGIWKEFATNMLNEGGSTITINVDINSLPIFERIK